MGRRRVMMAKQGIRIDPEETSFDYPFLEICLLTEEKHNFGFYFPMVAVNPELFSEWDSSELGNKEIFVSEFDGGYWISMNVNKLDLNKDFLEIWIYDSGTATSKENQHMILNTEDLPRLLSLEDHLGGDTDGKTYTFWGELDYSYTVYTPLFNTSSGSMYIPVYERLNDNKEWALYGVSIWIEGPEVKEYEFEVDIETPSGHSYWPLENYNNGHDEYDFSGEFSYDQSLTIRCTSLTFNDGTKTVPTGFLTFDFVSMVNCDIHDTFNDNDKTYQLKE